MPRLHFWAATDRPETTNLKLPPIPDVVWQQRQETHLINFHKTSVTETHKNIHIPESKQRNDVESQTAPLKETSSQVSESSTELLRGNQTGNTPVQSLNNTKKPQSEIQRHEMNITASHDGDDNFSLPNRRYSQIGEQLVRHDITKELYIQLFWNERKNAVCFSGFGNGLKIDALVVSGGYFSAIAQTELDKIKQQATANIFKIDDPPNFQIQVAND